MRCVPCFLFALSSLLVAGCGQSVAPSDGAPIPTVDAATHDAGNPVACTTAADCSWTEISAEILSRSQCPCLFGCPNIPVNRTTATRRQAQYAALCTPGHDGMGRPCGVDDCALPPTATCRAGVCQGP